MRFTKHLSTAIIVLGLFIFGISGCDSTGSQGVPGQDDVKVQFKTVSSSSSKTSTGNELFSSHDSLIVEGSNGTLKISDIRFIVEELKLEHPETDEEEDSSDSESEELEVGPYFVDMPLLSDTLVVGENAIKEGRYDELELEIGDLDFDDEEDGESYPELAESIRSEFSEWPEDASLVATGTFTNSDGQTKSFKVFADAEIEIEHEFASPIEVTADNITEVISVNIRPESWFKLPDGTALNLTDYDWDSTGDVFEFEEDFENGIEDVETDEEEDDEDDDEDEDDS